MNSGEKVIYIYLLINLLSCLLIYLSLFIFPSTCLFVSSRETTLYIVSGVASTCRQSTPRKAKVTGVLGGSSGRSGALWVS